MRECGVCVAYLAVPLHDTVSGARAMEQEVAEGMNDLVTQRFWNRKGPTVDDCPRSSDHRGHMANAALSFRKYRFPRLHVRLPQNRGVTRRHHSSANELREMVDCEQAGLIFRIFGIGCGLADGSCVQGF